VLDVRRLRVLREVARRGSLSRAAEVLSYTPSAVSQQIAALEREAGMALLERRARGVVLTEAGHTLVAHAHVILDRLEAAEAALAELADLRRGRLRMATFATAGASILPRAVDTFRARHPAVELTVGQADPDETVARLREGALDIGLGIDLPPSPAEGVEAIDLFDDPFRLALHRDHRLAAAGELSLADLREETWIDVPSSMSGGRVLAEACRRAGFTPRVAFESDDYTAIQELVGAGVGIALLPDLALRPRQDAVVLRALHRPALHRRIQAVTRTPAFRSPAAEAMLAVLRELAERRARAGEPGAAPQAVAAVAPATGAASPPNL
jgi:DNA-binding transcriptional LysR family regulator